MRSRCRCPPERLLPPSLTRVCSAPPAMFSKADGGPVSPGRLGTVSGCGSVVSLPLESPLTSREGSYMTTPHYVLAGPLGGANESTEGTHVGSASRSSSYPMPASPVIRPGDSTPSGLPQRQPF